MCVQCGMPDLNSEDMSERMSEDVSERMSEDVSERMSEDMSDRMSDDMSEGSSARMSTRFHELTIWKNSYANGRTKCRQNTMQLRRL